MKTYRIPTILQVLLTLTALVACAGGGSGGTGYSGGGVGGSGIVSRGAISEFGSIVVNGTAFKTTDTVVVVNGEVVGIGDAEDVGPEIVSGPGIVDDCRQCHDPLC